MDNGDAEHRSALITALRSDGLPAYEYHSGGGLMHVVVDLLIRTAGGTEESLQITTGDLATECDIALTGWRHGVGRQGTDWESVSTQGEARRVFLRYWGERQTWIQRFEQGQLNFE